MPIFTIIIGDVLVAVGILGYVLSDYASPTALIPAGLGFILNLCGALAMAQPKARKHAMHAACVIALLAVAGTARGLMKLPTYLSGGTVERPAAVVSQSITAIVCLVFLVVCVRSFILARRKRVPV